MIININLSRFAKRKKVPPVSREGFIDLAGKVVDESPASSPTMGPIAASRLIDHGKAPSADSHPPQPGAKHRPMALVDHGKQAHRADSHPPVPAARQPAARLIDLGKVS